MRNGATLDAMGEEIASAKATIDCSYYIYWPGETADRFSEAFTERARPWDNLHPSVSRFGAPDGARRPLRGL